MNFRTTILLLLCLAVFGGLYALSLGRGGGPEANPTGPALVAGELVAVKVTLGDRSYELRREDSEWRQTAPVWFPLEREYGQRWAWAARDLRVLEQIEAGANGAPSASALSLDPPTATVELITDGGAHRFELGDQTVTGDGYLRDETGDVFLVPAAVHALVYGQEPSASYRPVLPLPEPARVTTIELSRGTGNPVTLHRVDGQWSLEATRRQRIAPAFVSALRAASAEVPVLEVLSDAEPGRFGLGRLRAMMTLHVSDNETYELALGRSASVDGGGVFARVSRNGTPSPVLVLPDTLADLVNWPSDELRDHRVFDTSLSAVRAAKLERADGVALSVVDRGAGLVWEDVARPAETRAAAQGVDPDGFAQQVLGLHAQEWIAGFRTQRNPVAVVTVAWGVTHEAKAALFRDGPRWLVKRADEPDLAVVDENAVVALLGLLPN